MALENFNIPENLCQAVRYHDSHDRKLEDEDGFELELILRESVRIVDNLIFTESMKPDQIISQLHDRINDSRDLILKMPLVSLKGT